MSETVVTPTSGAAAAAAANLAVTNKPGNSGRFEATSRSILGNTGGAGSAASKLN